MHPLFSRPGPAGASAAPRRAWPAPCLAALLLLAAPAAAQRYHYGLPGAGLPGPAEYGQGILTAEQAEACLRRWRALSAAQQALEAEQARLDQIEAELAAPSRAAPARGGRPAMPGRGGGPQPSGPQAVSPEQAAAERQARFDAATQMRRQYMDSVERYRASAEAFNAQCATRRYYEADMRAARARLGIAE